MYPDSTTPMKTCRKCGRELPATTEYFYLNRGHLSSPCRDCISKYNKGYRETNADAVKARKKRYYEEHRTEIIATAKQWKLDNPERVKEWEAGYFPAYYQRNKSRYRENGKRWYANNPERAREHDKRYRKAHPDKVAAKFARRRNAPGHLTPEDIVLQHQSQKNKCWWCGKELGEKYHVDHVIPLARGGTNDPRNIVISCPECNMSKGAKLPHEWSGRLL